MLISQGKIFPTILAVAPAFSFTYFPAAAPALAQDPSPESHSSTAEENSP